MDIVIVTFQPDIKLLRHCLASYELYYQDKNRLFIFASESDGPLLARIRIPSNATIVLRESYPELEGTTDFGQQHYLKFIAFQLVTTEYFYIIDSDFLFIRPTSDADFFRDGKPVWYYASWHSDPGPLPRLQACEAFVEHRIDYSYDPIPHHLFKRSVAAHFASRYSLTNFLNRDQVKDFLLYGWFAHQHHPDEYCFIRSDASDIKPIARCVNQVPPDYCCLDPTCNYNQFKNYKIVAFWSHWDLAESKMIEFFEDSQRDHFGQVVTQADRTLCLCIVDLNEITKGRFRYFEGVFADGWVKSDVRCMVNVAAKRRSLGIELMIPANQDDPNWELTGRVIFGDLVKDQPFGFRPGMNTLVIQFQEAAEDRLIPLQLHFDRGFYCNDNPDPREFRARLCGMETLDAVTADRDVWEARDQQLTTKYEAVPQNPLLQSQIQCTIELERALEEKEEVIRGLQVEAECRREALDAVTADRDAWEARYRQLTVEAERRLEALETVSAHLDAVAQKSSSTNPESLETSAGQVAESQLARNPADSHSHAIVAPVGPLVSIITPSYNQGRFIEETILSVLTQDYPNIEYIVMDGGSTDNTLDILKKYEGRLTWISEADLGQSHAINKGFQMAKGEVLAWLNSDDTYLPGAVSKVVQHFQANPATMMVYGEGYLIDEQSRVKQRFPYTEAFNLWKLIYLWDNILQQTAFFRRQVFHHIDLLDENLHYGMDWDLWIRIGKKFRVDYISEYLGNLREYQEAKTSSGGITRFNELVALMRRHGTRRFPPAYFTYGFGTYNKSIFGSLPDRYPRAYQVFVSKLRKLGHAVGSRMTRYLVDHSQGVYSDGWTSPKAHFVLVNPGQVSHVRLEGELIKLRRGFHTVIRAQVNGRHLGDPITVFPGTFKLEWVIPQEMRSSDVLEVTLLSTRWHRPSLAGTNVDRRRLSYRITRISVE